MLGRLPKAPSAYNPINNPKRATQRQRYIIDRMLENGFHHRGPGRRGQRPVLHYRTPETSEVHAEHVAEVAAPAGLQPVRRRSLHPRAERSPDGRRFRPAAAYRAPRRASWTSSAARSIAARKPTSTCPKTAGSALTPGSPINRITRTTTSRRRPVVMEASRARRSWRCCSPATRSPSRRRPQTVASAWPRRRRAKDGDPPRRSGSACRGRRRLAHHPAARGRRRLRRTRPAPARSAPWSAGSTSQEQVQPRHPGLAATGLESSRSSTRRAGEGLHAGHGDQRCACLSSTPTPPAASPGSRRTTTASSTVRCRTRASPKSKNMVSIRIPARPSGVEYAAGVGHPFWLRGRKGTRPSDDGAGRRPGDAAADGHSPTACSQWRLPRQPVPHRGSPTAKASVLRGHRPRDEVDVWSTPATPS